MNRVKKIFFFFLVFLGLFNSSAWADEFFETSLNIQYQITAGGDVWVEQEVHLTNLTAERYATSYHLELTGQVESVTAKDESGPIQPQLSLEDKTRLIDLEFNQPVLGEGSVKKFTINYQLNDFLEKNGKVWEVHLPPIPQVQELSSANVSLIAPYEIGPLAYITPEPTSISNSNSARFYTYNQSDLSALGINAAFGEAQVFEFELQYHLINPYNTKGVTQISLPPDTTYQRVVYDQIEPAPSQTWYDEDGNLMAEYQLKPKEKIDVITLGRAVLQTSPHLDRPATTELALSQNLLAQEYWEVTDPRISELAQELKTPRAIFDYTVNALKYDDTIANSEIIRQGALGALDNPNHALCMEFTDLFVTLARAAGIPAREAIGFAFTNRINLKPAQNTIDILHSWPEYWDEKEARWIPVDPTWENTTQGRDYFSRLDLNHFVFTYHGTSSTQPAPAGSYKTGQETAKDIIISFGSLIETTPSPLTIGWEVPLSFFGKPTAQLSIYNPGPQTIYDLTLEISGEEIELDPGYSLPASLLVLAPFETRTIPVKLKRVPFWRFGPASLNLTTAQETFTYNLRLEQLTWPRLVFFSLTICLVVLLIYLLVIKKKKKVVSRSKTLVS